MQTARLKPIALTSFHQDMAELILKIMRQYQFRKPSLGVAGANQLGEFASRGGQQRCAHSRGRRRRSPSLGPRSQLIG